MKTEERVAGEDRGLLTEKKTVAGELTRHERLRTGTPMVSGKASPGRCPELIIIPAKLASSLSTPEIIRVLHGIMKNR